MNSHELILKSPIYEDVSISFSWDWTVLDLKRHISSNYLAKPKVEEQRLICCGRLLKDEQLLKDIIKTEKTYFHICTSPIIEPKTNVCNDLKFKQKSVNLPASQEAISLSNMTEGIRNDMYNVPYSNLNSGLYSQEYMQIYHQNLMNSWNLYYYNISQYYQSIYSQNIVNPNIYSIPYMPMHPMINTTQFNGNSGNDNGNNQNNLINNPNVANNVAANNMMAAPGGIGLGAAEEANGNERVDLVDWIYVFFRVGILFSILYFYSSINRFLVVLLFSTLVFLYQAGFLVYPRRNNPAQPEPASATPNLSSEPNPDELPGQEVPLNGPESTSDTLSSRVKDKMMIVWNGTRAVLIVFATFFTSLIPDRPPPVNLN